jgi:ATP-dependent Clp protease protease subunit
MSDITRPMALDAGFDPRSDVFNRLLKNRVIMLGTDVNDDIGQPDLRPAAVPRGEDGLRHLAVHQQPRRLGHRGHGDLRHDAVHLLRRRHGVHGHGRFDGPVPPHRGCSRQALHVAQRAHHDAPAARRVAWPGHRHRHPGRATPLHQAAHGRTDCASLGQTLEQIQKDSERDRWFTADQAKAYGLVDSVKTKRGELPN